ncbi:MAG: pyruvate, phosphate dikinase [Chloroflexi bacterium]|nr:pyruvate, phosphate dikinase [Chloroflexota bacterium]MCI0726486.1 pyruvate, phosphate dikinase [Chloroflexota bacterium]
MADMICSFNELTMEQRPFAGGKGGTLARLYQAGYPVPDGFVILTTAFEENELKPKAWAEIRAQLEHMQTVKSQANHESTFAVRSSALSEDFIQASFAGEFETVLNVGTDEEFQQAIHTVCQSRESDRVQTYSEAQSIHTNHKIAIVVQRMIQAETSGVLFTADPVTGSHLRMVGNFVHGSGEQLVSGRANPHTFTLKRPRGQYEGPPELKRFASRLYKMASRLEKELGCPQDIEWTVSRGRLFLLQSRPITTLQGYNPTTGEWNDSLTGDFLWANGNIGEAFPDVMTPCTWSLVQLWLSAILPFRVPGGYPTTGNIGGRIYVNLSLFVYAYRLFGMKAQKALEALEDALGRPAPEGLKVPELPLRFTELLSMVVGAIKILRTRSKNKSKLPNLVATVPQWCASMGQRIQQTDTREALAALWRDELEATIRHTFLVGSASVDDEGAIPLRRDLTRLVGADDANVLLANLSGDSELLASLEPLVDLAKVARGEMSDAAYLEQHGHRGPHEAELSIAGPAEDPNWLKQQLAEFAKSPVDLEALLAKRRSEFDAAWARFQDRYPRKAKAIQRRLEQVAAAARIREAVRSEVTRIFRIVRAYALRAGQLTGLGDDVFFLPLNELLDVLSGDDKATIHIPARRETYARYKALPRYPSVICGRFDPLQWASDPNRRSDIFDAHASVAGADADTITGFAGSAGRAKGIICRLDSVEEGEQLQPGEILVTAMTNIGWTLLFTRAAAIVTDVGAPLSHAVIVARELGIPAVVGCGNATRRLHTGDLVLVDGGQGVVEILEPLVRKSGVRRKE